MEIKKNPKFNLENYSKLLIQLGLVLALFITYVSMEHKTYEKDYDNLGIADLGAEVEEETLIMNAPPPPPPPPATPPPPPPKVIEVIKNNEEIVETILESSETNESEVVEVHEIVEVTEDEYIVEDVSFAIIEDGPVFPGCKGSKQEKKNCFNKYMHKHVQKYFNADLGNELGLASGKRRIYAQFKIDKDGSITAIKVRAPHPRLKKEAERVVRKLPRMIPGKQRGKPVRVGYTLPITFNIE